MALVPLFFCSLLISSAAQNDTRPGERCSIKGHVRDAIDVNCDVSVTTTRPSHNGTSPTQESKLRAKNNISHTHRVSRTNGGVTDIYEAICLILRNNWLVTQIMMWSRKELWSELVL
jgi:hypothetical protein